MVFDDCLRLAIFGVFFYLGAVHKIRYTVRGVSAKRNVKGDMTEVTLVIHNDSMGVFVVHSPFMTVFMVFGIKVK